MPDPTTSEAVPRKYWAFISYSQRDKEWSGWLQRAIENYRVPRRFVGRTSRDGAVPRRLFPVFRDREELPTSADLGSNIEQALRASRYLIVVCSPNGATSRWVNEEVRGFKALGREDRVLAIIVDGEPNASDKADAGVPECFPPALRYRVGSDGQLTQERTEPIAADARPDRDGRSSARLKILAGLLGVGFDELRQRERVRRRRRSLLVAVTVIAVFAALLGTWFLQERAKRREVDRQLASKYEERARQLAEKGDPVAAALFFAAANRLAPSLTRRDSALLHLQHLVLPTLSVAHEAKISCAAFAPGGDRFLTMSDTGLEKQGDANPGLLRVWDSKSGVRHWETPIDNDTYYFRRAVFTRDGKRIFTALENARLWDSHTGKPIAPPISFKPIIHEGNGFTESSYVERAGLDASEKTVVLKWNENFVQSWDAETSRPLGPGGPHAGNWSDLAFLWEGERIPQFSPDGKILVRGSDMGGPLQLVDVASGKQIAQSLQQEAVIEAAAFSPDGSQVVTGSVNGAAYIWSIRSESEVSRSDARMMHPGIVSLVKFSPNGQFILTVSGDSAYLWNKSAQLEMVMPAPGAIATATFSADSESILTGSEDGTGLVWNVGQRRFLPRLISRDDWQRLRQAILSPDGRTLFAQWFPEQKVIGFTANSVVSEPIGNIPAHIQLWDVRTGRRLWKQVEHQPEITAVAFSPDASIIATVDRTRIPGEGSQVAEKRTLRFWNAKTGDLLGEPYEIRGRSGGDSETPETVLAFAPDGSRLLLVHNQFLGPVTPGGGLTAQAVLKLFDGRTSQPIGEELTVAKRISGTLFLRSGDILLAGDDEITRWPASQPQPSADPFIKMPRVLSLAVSPDEKTLLAVSRSSGRLWDLTSHLPIGDVLEKPGMTEIHNVAFSPDGRLAITTDGRIVRLWDPRTGAPIGQSFSFASSEPSFGHPPRFVEGGHLLAVGRDGIWEKDISWLLRKVSPQELLAETELFTRRRISPAGAIEIIPAGEWTGMARSAATKKEALGK